MTDSVEQTLLDSWMKCQSQDTSAQLAALQALIDFYMEQNPDLEKARPFVEKHHRLMSPETLNYGSHLLKLAEKFHDSGAVESAVSLLDQLSADFSKVEKPSAPGRWLDFHRLASTIYLDSDSPVKALSSLKIMSQFFESSKTERLDWHTYQMNLASVLESHGDDKYEAINVRQGVRDAFDALSKVTRLTRRAEDSMISNASALASLYYAKGETLMTVENYELITAYIEKTEKTPEKNPNYPAILALLAKFKKEINDPTHAELAKKALTLMEPYPDDYAHYIDIAKNALT
jgi:hypothetical protein